MAGSDPLKDTRIGRKHWEVASLLNEDSIIKAVEKQAWDLVTHLISRLEGKVYRDQDIVPCSVLVVWGQRKFQISSVEFDSTLVQQVRDELKVQYRVCEDPANKENLY